MVMLVQKQLLDYKFPILKKSIQKKLYQYRIKNIKKMHQKQLTNYKFLIQKQDFSVQKTY
jgi:hypothetical protein